MTRIRIPAQDIEEDVSAEQVAAYLLGNGWSEPTKYRLARWFERDRESIRVGIDSDGIAHGADLAECIHDIARAEGRHPSAVLAAIVGPVVGSVGVGCAP